MKDFLKSISSLIIAIVILCGILFLPEADFNKVDNLLNFLSNSSNTAESFGYYLLQKLIIGVVIVSITILISITAHRVFVSEKEAIKEDED